MLPWWPPSRGLLSLIRREGPIRLDQVPTPALRARPNPRASPAADARGLLAAVRPGDGAAGAGDLPQQDALQGVPQGPAPAAEGLDVSRRQGRQGRQEPRHPGRQRECRQPAVGGAGETAGAAARAGGAGAVSREGEGERCMD